MTTIHMTGGTDFDVEETVEEVTQAISALPSAGPQSRGLRFVQFTNAYGLPVYVNAEAISAISEAAGT